MIAALLAFAALSAVADTGGPGTAAPDFARNDGGPHSAALAGAGSALEDGLFSIGSNPAGLLSVNGLSIAMQQTAWVRGFGIGDVRLGAPVGQSLALAAGYAKLDAPRVQGYSSSGDPTGWISGSGWNAFGALAFRPHGIIAGVDRGFVVGAEARALRQNFAGTPVGASTATRAPLHLRSRRVATICQDAAPKPARRYRSSAATALDPWGPPPTP